MQVDVLFASVPVTDLGTATAWYALLFGRPADIVPNEREVMWQVTDGAWLYVIEGRERAGHTLVTLCVGDLDEAAAAIASRGLRVSSIDAVGDAGRRAWLRDPDGNAVAVIEVTP